METFCCTLEYVCRLLVCIWLSLALNNVDGCFKEQTTVSPRSFVFEALPSINASLGEKLELRCFVDGSNSTSILVSIALLSRTVGFRELNSTCKFFANGSGGECRYTIPELQPWHGGTYDCIKIYTDKKCFSKTLELSVSSRRLHPSSTSSTIRYTAYTTEKSMAPELNITILKHATPPTSGSTWTARYWNNNMIIFVFFVNFLF